MATAVTAALETGSFQSQQASETLSGSTMPASKRRSHSREKKLKILKYYHENGRNKYRTCQKFGIPKGCFYQWLKNEKKIHDGSKGSKRIEGGGRKPFWPDVEEKLLAEFTELRAKGLKVKHYWFRARAVQLMSELHPDVEFKFSPGWFDRFKVRNKISYRRSTNVAQTKPADMEDKIRAFHLEIRRVAASKDSEEPMGKFQLSTVANVDQTPLPFTFNGGQGYSKTGEKTVWHRGAASGLDKRQCTVQLTIFADGEARVPPLLIFRGKGLRISQVEKTKYDRRVRVQFQENAWCDEAQMLNWVNHIWKRPFSPDVEKPKLLIADVHKAQKTEKVLHALEACKTTVVLVPPGCTSLVQPLDVVVNANFKQIVDRLQTEHMQQNLEQYVNNSLSASQRRILITGWVGAAWAEVCLKKDMIKRGFEKCGISVPIDGSRDEDISIHGLTGYVVRKDASSSEIESDEDDLFELDSSEEEEY